MQVPRSVLAGWVAVGVAAAACGGESAAPSASPPRAEEPVTVVDRRVVVVEDTEVAGVSLMLVCVGWTGRGLAQNCEGIFVGPDEDIARLTDDVARNEALLRCFVERVREGETLPSCWPRQGR